MHINFSVSLLGFPILHSHPAVKREIVNDLSLLYTIHGTKSGILPYLLASHLDVVPVNEKGWSVPPFGGVIVNNTYIYGRGAMDDKCGVLVSIFGNVETPLH